jgi:hypothetical protein
MKMQNVFDAKEAQQYIDRINQLTPETQRKWGKMSVSQMLAHCNVAYSLALEPEKHKKPSFIAKFLLSRFVKPKSLLNTLISKIYQQVLFLLFQTKEILKKKRKNSSGIFSVCNN